jgi:hypothetical protein
MKDVISTTKAREIDDEWIEAGYPTSGLRIVGYRIARNRSRMYLTIPGDDAAPCYEFLTHNPETGDHSPAYYHVSGPTLAEWKERLEQERLEQEQAEAAREAAELYEWASGR